MRKILTLVALMAATSSATVFAQEPTDRWPYLYDSFVAGSVRTQDGNLLERKLNVCVDDGGLHYIGGDKILAAKMLTVFSARIADDYYLRVGTKMLKMVAEQEDAAVLEGFVVDKDKLEATNIGYGISSQTASSTRLAGMSVSSGMVNQNLNDALSMKDSGRPLPLKRTVYLRYGNRIVQATRHAVLETEGLDKDAAKAFLKENKIKWNKTESLLKVAVFLKQYE